MNINFHLLINNHSQLLTWQNKMYCFRLNLFKNRLSDKVVLCWPPVILWEYLTYFWPDCVHQLPKCTFTGPSFLSLMSKIELFCSKIYPSIIFICFSLFGSALPTAPSCCPCSKIIKKINKNLCQTISPSKLNYFFLSFLFFLHAPKILSWCNNLLGI